MRRNHIRISMSLLLAGAMLLSLSFSMFAFDDTQYLSMYVPTGANQNLLFKDNSANAFHFDNAVPGDSVTQYITIENLRSEKVTVYVKAAGIENPALLDQLRLTVSSGNTILYRGSLSGNVTTASGATQNVGSSGISLGVCQPASMHYVTAKIEIPTTVGNEFAAAGGKITWAFYAEYGGSGSGGGSGGSSGGRGSGSSGGTDRRDTDPERRVAQILDEDIPLGGNLFTVADDQIPLTSLPRTGGRFESTTSYPLA